MRASASSAASNSLKGKKMILNKTKGISKIIEFDHKHLNAYLRYCVRPIMEISPLSRTSLNLLQRTLDVLSVNHEDRHPECTFIQTHFRHVPTEIIKRKGSKNKNAILYLHGGGFVACNPRTHRVITTALCKQTGMDVIVPDYRKAPEHLFPAQIDDATMVYSMILDNMQYDNIVIAGDSAGANMALVTTHLAIRHGLRSPHALVLMSPWVDLTCSMKSHETNAWRDVWIPTRRVRKVAKMYAGNYDINDHLVSPINMNFEEFPPTMIHVGDNECLLSDSIELFDRMQYHGVDAKMKIWKDGCHVFQGCGFLKQGKESLRELSDFIRSTQ